MTSLYDSIPTPSLYIYMNAQDYTSSLNQSISLWEVAYAHTGKTTSADCIPAEVLEYIHSLQNNLVPESW